MKEKYNILFQDVDGSVIKKYSNIDCNTKIILPKPKKFFYKFVGWNPNFNKKINHDQVYVAQYIPNTDNNSNGISDEEEFYSIINDIINNKEFLKRKDYHHHGNTSVYDHCLAVAYYTFKISKRLKLDYKSATIGAILHDFYYKDWQKNTEKKPFFKQHGFVHAHEALDNSKNFFPNMMNKKVENSIERHMFPLNVIPPKYLEGWVVSLSDKIVSFDTVENPKILLSFFFKRYRK